MLKEKRFFFTSTVILPPLDSGIISFNFQNYRIILKISFLQLHCSEWGYDSEVTKMKFSNLSNHFENFISITPLLRVVCGGDATAELENEILKTYRIILQISFL